MKKKMILLIIFILQFTVLIFADEQKNDIEFIVEDLRFSSELNTLFAPYLRAGIDYNGFKIFDGYTTDLIAIVGGGIITSNVWTDLQGIQIRPDDPVLQSDSFSDLNSYSKWQWDGEIILQQNLVNDVDKDVFPLSVYSGVLFHYTSPFENENDSSFFSGDASVYPDQAGILSNGLKLGFKIDGLKMEKWKSGYLVDFSLLFAPEWLFNNQIGRSDFCSFKLYSEGYLPIFSIKQENNLELISLYIADRISAHYIIGSAIPQYFQEEPSLGKKMRGFEDYSYGTDFTIVNNFDFRFYGIEIFENFNPIFNVFLDTGYYAGNYYNTSTMVNGFLCSTGFEAGINVFNILQLGYALYIPLLGSNISGEDYVASLLIVYHF